jgi:hypothetical protein
MFAFLSLKLNLLLVTRIPPISGSFYWILTLWYFKIQILTQLHHLVPIQESSITDIGAYQVQGNNSLEKIKALGIERRKYVCMCTWMFINKHTYKHVYWYMYLYIMLSNRFFKCINLTNQETGKVIMQFIQNSWMNLEE